MTGDMGLAYPCGLVEVLPGDTFSHRASSLIRLSPMTAPVMHPITIRVHHFFVPNRILWDGWEDFITGGPDNNDTADIPTVTTTGAGNDLHEYFGLPRVSGVEVNALPYRAFNKIWSEYYRDQDLQAERSEDDITIPNIAWSKDMFTAARPWEQKGPDVTLPLGTIQVDTWTRLSDPSDTGRLLIRGTQQPEGPAGSIQGSNPIPNTSVDTDVVLTGDGTAIDINELRRAFALQRFAEARAQYGSRYVEYLAHLGIKSSNARLDRPEYLGGGKQRVAISEVLQTGPEADRADPSLYGVGDMYGHGIASTSSNRYRKFFEEHGYVVSILSVRPHAMYQDGIPRHMLRQDRNDYFQKELQYIGQQPVWNSEVYAQAGAAGYETFGYQDRYKEYREQPSTVVGEFRDQLNHWHLARQFAEPPVLNEEFIRCNPSKRIFNIQTEDVLWMMVQHHLVARRLVAPVAVGRIL